MALAAINPTQAVGTLAFLVTGLVAAWAARTHRGSIRRVWAVFALLYGLFLVEVLIGARHAVHQLVNDGLMHAGHYSGRRELQVMLVLMLSLSTVAAGVWVRRTSLSRLIVQAQASTAAWGTLGVALLFALELISLHQIDAVLYFPLGPVAAIGWLWAAAAMATSLGACASLRHARTPPGNAC